jgi:hypothetical protein
VYATKNLEQAKKEAGTYGMICAVRLNADVAPEREFGAWFSVYATFSRWMEMPRQVRGSVSPSTPDQDQSSA